MKSNPIKILVVFYSLPYSGTSIGICKSLALSKLEYELFTVSSSNHQPGIYLFGKGALTPAESDPDYIPWLVDYCRRLEIDVIFPDDGEYSLIADYRDTFLERAGTLVMANPQHVIDITRNKLNTNKWLLQSGFNFTPFTSASDSEAVERLADEVGYPLIAKPCSGEGSTGIYVVKNKKDLCRLDLCREYIVEKYIGTSDKEYTSACFLDKEGVWRGIIIMRRILCHGASQFCDVERNLDILEECRRIAVTIGIRGTANLQFRFDEGKPVCFDINPRYSSTCGIRAHFGFNDVEAGVRNYVLGEAIDDLPLIASGKVLRYIEEVFIDDR